MVFDWTSIFFKVILLAAAIASAKRKLILVRHSITQMNEYLANVQPWGTPGFVDPLYFDTRLSEKGVELALQKNKKIKSHLPSLKAFRDIELIASSPLTRALTTSDLILSDDIVDRSVSRMAIASAREWLFLSSDVGRTKDILQNEFPNWDFSGLPQNEWWYVRKSTDPSPELDFRGDTQKLYGYTGEPLEAFVERMKVLRNWLQSRSENTMALVCHYGVLKALTGKDFQNAQILEYDPDSLLDDIGIRKQSIDIIH
jgi:broad specificity phosphatase PhoE